MAQPANAVATLGVDIPSAARATPMLSPAQRDHVSPVAEKNNKPTSSPNPNPNPSMACQRRSGCVPVQWR